MANRHPGVLLVLAFVLVALGACANARADTPGKDQGSQPRTVSVGTGSYTEIDAASLAQMLQRKDFVLVNVHTPYAGEIAGTDAFVPYDQIVDRLEQLPADKRARLVVYCRSGMMSDIAARTLVQLGYADVWTLKGGMAAWEQAGNTLLQKPQAQETSASNLPATPDATPAARDSADDNKSAPSDGDTPVSTLPAEARSSDEGSVTVQVTPDEAQGQALDFSVSLNTHSVELSYDLLALATLRDDRGHAYPATGWDGGSGGHHLSGKLAFADAASLLAPGVKWIELELRDIAGVPVRTFRWNIG